MAAADCEPGPLVELQVMVAGLPRTGKSTGLNNIFDLDLPAGLSATPITKGVVSRKIPRNGISLTVTDTPGLRAANANTDKATLQDMKKIGENKVLLLLVLPVSPSNSITEDYCKVLDNLHTIMGHQIWDWCLVLLTFSDTARESHFRSEQDKHAFQDYLKGHCTQLQKALAKIGVKRAVKPFFEYTDEKFENETLDGIVAIPVGKASDYPVKKLLPLQLWAHEYEWTDLAFAEIVKLNGQIQLEEQLKETRKIEKANQLRTALIQFKYGCIKFQDIVDAGMDGAEKGAKVGSEAGEIVGDIIGGIIGIKKKEIGIRQGRELGILLGEIIGKVSGALSIGGAAASVLIVKYIIQQTKLRQKEKRLLELEQTK